MKNFILLVSMIIMPSTLSAQEIVQGLYVSAFERSDFMPCGLEEHWWLHGAVYSEIEKFIIENSLRKNGGDWNPNLPVYIEVVGTKSKKGKWGHLGAYQHEFKATRLVSISVNNKCD